MQEYGKQLKQLDGGGGLKLYNSYRNQLPMFSASPLSSLQENASCEEEYSLNLELILEPAVDHSPTTHSIATTASDSHSPTPPTPTPTSTPTTTPRKSSPTPACPPLSFDTFLQQLRCGQFKRRGSVSLKLKIARRRRGCSICQEWVQEKSVVHNLHCRHTFHRHCLLQWAQKHNSCPLCRHSLR